MQETVKRVLTGDFNKKKGLWFLLTALLTIIVWNLPASFFGIDGLTIVQQRVIAIFVMAVMLWLTEAIPAWATSVCIIFVLLFFVSDSSFKFMQGEGGEYGLFLDSVGIMACFADPTIILFLGGFILAIAATKSGLDVWMAIMAPLVIALLFIAWLLLCRLFPFTGKTIELDIQGEMQHNWRTIVVAVTMVVTILLWIFGKPLGINANTVAMLPIAVFALTGVITAKDLQEIDWGVIWMVAGGFALGMAMNGTDLAKTAINAIPFGDWNPIVILLIAGLVTFFLSNFISNTATAALMIPILTVVCAGMGDKLNIIGGSSTVIVGIAVAASAAMCLPISTPPNAIAYSTGLIEQKDMGKAGILVGIITLILGFSLLIAMGKLGIF